MPKLSDLQNLPAAASNDLIPILDVSEALPQNVNKTITVLDLLSNVSSTTGIQATTQNTGMAPTSTPPNGTIIVDQTGNGTLYVRVNNTWKSVALV